MFSKEAILNVRIRALRTALPGYSAILPALRTALGSLRGHPA